MNIFEGFYFWFMVVSMGFIVAFETICRVLEYIKGGF